MSRQATVPPARRPHRSDGAQTRQRVLDAAVATITELGYYRASSNEIARRAGVTWGAIQHQFRTRDALLLEVLNARWDAVQQSMASAEITGATLEQRLACLLAVLAEHYGSPLHLVQLQILLDLGGNPDRTAEVRAAARVHGQRLVRAWQPLFDRTLGAAATEADLVRYAFLTLRGYLAGELIGTTVAGTRPNPELRHLLVAGVAATIRSEATRRGLAV